MNAFSRLPRRNSDLELSLSRAAESIEACVLIGGDLFARPSALKLLDRASQRKVPVKILFPSPSSRWLHGFAVSADVEPEYYARRVVLASRRAASALPDCELRWYDAPGPCWFVLIDRSELYTKPFSLRLETVPYRETRQDVTEHFTRVFQQLWDRSTLDYEYLEKPDSPRVLKVVDLSKELLAKLSADPKLLSTISPETFEMLVADRLTAMGMSVQRVGPTNKADGGIDIIAWPERNVPFAYVLAVQAKHSRTGAKVGPAPIRDLRGVLSSTSFDCGMVVTNTRFTPAASWTAEHGNRRIRLRNFDDVVRWVKNDFKNEPVIGDLPGEILLAPGLTIRLPS